MRKFKPSEIIIVEIANNSHFDVGYVISMSSSGAQYEIKKKYKPTPFRLWWNKYFYWLGKMRIKGLKCKLITPEKL